LGLAIGLYAIVLGVTGSILVFREELKAARVPRFVAVPPPMAQRPNPELRT
jgi:uncharacterized iron-regulated membrane protein